MTLNIFRDELTPLEHALELASAAADAFATAGNGDASMLCGALALAVMHGREGELCAACRAVATDLFLADEDDALVRLEARLLLDAMEIRLDELDDDALDRMEARLREHSVLTIDDDWSPGGAA